MWYNGNGYIYCCGDGTTGGTDWANDTPSFRDELDDGGILDITLNLDERKIYLSINGGDAILPSSFENIKMDKYRLVVTMYHAQGTIIELL